MKKRTKKSLHNTGTFAFFIVVGIAFYFPDAGLQRQFIFGSGWDPWIYIWFLNWWPFAWEHGLPLFHTSFVDAPIGESLAWKTGLPSLALVAAPVTAAFGSIATYNILMLIAPGTAAWGTYLAAHEVTGRAAPSIVAGLIFGFSSYELAQLLAHLNLAFVAAIPLGLWICLRATRRGWKSWQLGLSLGPLLGFEFGVAQEIYATCVVFGAIAVLTAYVLDPQLRPRLTRMLPGLALALAVSVVLAAPFIWQMLIRYGTGAASVSSPASASNDLLGFIVPTPVTLLGGRLFAPVTRTFTDDLAEQGAYVGLPLLALLIHIVRSNRPQAAFRIAGLCAVIAAVLSLGPFAHFLGVTVSTAPWIAAAGMPFLKAMLPARFVMYAWLAIALLVALWLARPGPARGRYLVLAACLLFIVPDRSVARQWTPIRVPEIVATLPETQLIPRGSHVLILPELGEALSYQFLSGMDFELVGQGYLGNGVPPSFARWHLFQPLFDNEFSHIDPPEFAAYLAAFGVQYVVLVRRAIIDPGPDESPVAAALLRAAGWQVVATTADATVFRPGPDQAAPSAAQVALYTGMPSERRTAKRIRTETQWVCAIRRFAGFIHLDAGPLLRLYEARARPPLPPAAIGCARA